MEVKMQTSFIPKKPVVSERAGGSGISLFFLISIIIFVVAIILTAGVWLWRESLVKQIVNDEKALAKAIQSYEEKETLEPLIRLNDRIEISGELLSKHLAITPVFSLLEKNVLRNIQLKTMDFAYDDNAKIQIALTGTASSYDALSKQSDAFGSENLRKFISNPVISEFNPTEDGSIAFTFNASIDPALVSYENVVSTNN